MSYVRRFIRIRFAIIATVIRTPVYCIKFPGRDFIQLQRAEVRERAKRAPLQMNAYGPLLKEVNSVEEEAR